MQVNCGRVKASCRCIRKAGHEGPCICDCTGSYDDKRIYALPIVSGMLNEDTVEDYYNRMNGGVKPAEQK